MPEDQRPAFDRSLDRQQRRDAAVRTRQSEEELRREIAESVDAVDIDPQRDIETRVRDGQVTGGLTRDAQERVVRTEVSESVDEIDVDPQEDIRIETEDGEVVGGSLTRDAQRRVVASELDQQVSRIDVGPDDVDLKTENGEVVGGELTSEAEDRVEAEIQRERRQARNRARRRAQREIEEETGMDVSGSDIKIEDGEVRTTEEFERRYAAEQLDDEIDADIGVDDVKLGDDGATLREETQREIAAEQFEQELSSEVGGVAGFFGRITGASEPAIEDIDVSPEDVRLEDDGATLTEDFQQEVAAERLEQDVSFGVFDRAAREISDITGIESIRPDPDVDFDAGDVRLEEGSVTLRDDARREVAAERIEQDLSSSGIVSQIPGLGESGSSSRDIRAEDIRLEGDTARLRDDVQREVVADQVRSETGADIGAGDITIGDSGPSLDTSAQQRVAAAQIEDEYGVEVGQGEVFVADSGEIELMPSTEREIQRTQFAEEAGVDPEDVTFKTVRRSSSDFTPRQSMDDVQFTEEEIPVLEEDAVAERAAAQDPDLEPSDLDIDWSGGDYQIEVTGEAQERIAREEIAEEHDVDPSEVDISREDGELVGEIEEDGGFLDSVRSVDAQDVLAAPALAGGTAARAINDPSGTAESVVSAPLKAQSVVVGSALSTADDPTGTAESAGSAAVDIGETVGTGAYEGITEPVDTSGFGLSIDGTVGEVNRRVQDDLDRNFGESADIDIDVDDVLAAPAVGGGIAARTINDPVGTAETVIETPIRAQSAVMYGGAEAIDFGSEVIEESRDSRAVAGLTAAAPVAAAEPTPFGEAAIGAAAFGVGIATAGTVALDRYGDSEVEIPDDNEFRRSEIAAPREPDASRRSEIEAPENPRETASEIGTPTRQDERPEIEVPDRPREVNEVGIPAIEAAGQVGRFERLEDDDLIGTGSAVIGEDAEETITSDDLVDPEELRRDYLEELGQQIEDQQEWIREQSDQEYLEEQDPVWTVDQTDEPTEPEISDEQAQPELDLFGSGSPRTGPPFPSLATWDRDAVEIREAAEQRPEMDVDVGSRVRSPEADTREWIDQRPEMDIGVNLRTSPRTAETAISSPIQATNVQSQMAGVTESVGELQQETPERFDHGNQYSQPQRSQRRTPQVPWPEFDSEDADEATPETGWVSEDFFNPFASPGEILGFGGPVDDDAGSPFGGGPP